jgi:uncharacterized membrane protein
MRPALFVVVVGCAATFILLTCQQLPAIVAAHFDGSGAADGFMPFRTYVGLMLALLVGLPTLTLLLIHRVLRSPNARINIPNREYWLAPERRAETVHQLKSGLLCFYTFLLVFLCYLHWLLVLANGREPPALPSSWFIGGLVIFLAVVFVWLSVFLARFRRIG